MTEPAFTSYDALLDGVREILSSADVGRHRDRGRRKAHLYWQLGDSIHTHLLHHQARATYGEGLFKRLSEDLRMDLTTLYLTVECRRALPNLDTYQELTWSHCRQVFSLPTLAERELYLRVAQEQNWTVRQLKDQIRAGLYARVREIGSAAYRPASTGAGKALRARRGVLHTYRLIPATTIPGSGDLVVDQGFGIRWTGPLHGLTDPRPGLFVTAERRRGRGQTGATYTFHPAASKSTRQLYTFAAGVERIIDGDTLIVAVDCGFNTVVRQRLRLRGIDTPELGSLAGQRAHERVAELLADLPFIIMSTSRTDRYGRYLADLFYLPQTQDAARVLRDGIYLNRQLLDEGLARPYP